MSAWAQTGFAWTVIAVAVIMFVAWICPEWIKDRIRDRW